MVADSVLGAVLAGALPLPACDLASEWRVHRCGTRTVRQGGFAWLDNDGVNLAATAFAALARGRGLAGLVSLTPAARRLQRRPIGAAHRSARRRVRHGHEQRRRAAAPTLVGTWRPSRVIEVPGDLQTWTTTWRFDADGTCRQTVVTESLAEGFPRTTERTCTWTANDSQVTISFVGRRHARPSTSRSPGSSPDRLVLDGFEYQRLA